MADVLAHFSVGDGVTPAADLLTHLTVSGIYGLAWGYLFRIVRRLLPAPAWLMGLAYGLLLFLVAQGVFLAGPTPSVGIPSTQLVVGHGVYGLALGLQNRQSS
ncbi:MAG: hypothetical protein KF753_16670 [Caldilineaceae bacterium]|nr:hypothetical protein [Caldilineaceae bacterium]